jgi:mRNA export factor
MFDMNSGQAQQVAAHDAPIKCVEYVETNGTPVLITAGWDKKMKVSLAGFPIDIS